MTSRGCVGPIFKNGSIFKGTFKNDLMGLVKGEGPSLEGESTFMMACSKEYVKIAIFVIERRETQNLVTDV